MWLSNQTIFHVIKEGCKSYKDQQLKVHSLRLSLNLLSLVIRGFFSKTKTLLKRWNTCYKCKITLDYWLTMSCKDVDAKKGNETSQNHIVKVMFWGRTWWTRRTNEKHSTQTQQHGSWIRLDTIKRKTQTC